MIEFRWIFLITLGLTFISKLILNARQATHIAEHRTAVPEEFSDSISLDAHHKAADYSRTKLRFGRWHELYDNALLLVWTLGGGLALLDTLVTRFSWSPLMTGITVIIALMLISSVLSLPFSWYSTFNIEAKYGFNKSTPKIFWMDLIKGMTLSIVIGTPLIALILWIMQKAGSYWWIWAWVAWSAFSLLMLWAYPRFIAPIFNKFTPLEDEALKNRINGLLEKCGFKSNGVFVMDGSTRSSHGNAYFTGIGDNKRIVFFDTLLETLDDNETEAVLAHELGHFRKKHVSKRMLMSFVFSFLGLALLGWLVEKEWFYTALGISEPSNHMALILFMLVMPVFTYFLSPIGSWFSRKNEFEADAYAAEQSDANALISGLLKMYSDNASTLTPDPWYSFFYHSHPPALHRIQHLNNLAK
jgi:STE24 endopeptidase